MDTELRHMNKRHNSKGKHKAHRQNKMFNDVESIKEFIEKHDFRSRQSKQPSVEH